MTFHEPFSIAILDQSLGQSCDRILRHQDVNRKCRQRARRNREQVTLIPNQRFDWTEELQIKVVGGTEVELLELSLSGGIRRTRSDQAQS